MRNTCNLTEDDRRALVAALGTFFDCDSTAAEIAESQRIVREIHDRLMPPLPVLTGPMAIPLGTAPKQGPVPPGYKTASQSRAATVR
jgi:hypothetical protein